MGETGGSVRPGAKFLSSYEPGKPDKLHASKIQWGDKEQTFPFQKGEAEKKKRVMVLSKPETWQGKFHEILSLKNTPLWFSALPSRPAGDGGPAFKMLPLRVFLKLRCGPEDPSCLSAFLCS